MNDRLIHGKTLTIPASDLLESVGDAIGRIKHARRLTYGDVGAAFGKSEDVAASYRAGASDMPLSSFVRGVAAYGPELADAALGPAGYHVVATGEPERTDDAAKIATFADLIKALATRAHDGLDDGELREICEDVMAAGAVIDELRVLCRRAKVRAA